ncbi:MAG TPA: hypothetical protein V6C81_30660 [Planktothrix sp.]|jgi:hypothetical protein
MSDSDNIDELARRRRKNADGPDVSSKRPRRKPPEADDSPNKNAAGYGQSWGFDLQPGNNVLCQIIGVEPGGYTVRLKQYDRQGFLPTQALLRPGEEVLAQFVCVHKQRIFVSLRLSLGTETRSKRGVLMEQNTPVEKVNHCLRKTFRFKRATDLLPILDGKYCGAFWVEKQEFSTDQKLVEVLIKENPDTTIEPSIALGRFQDRDYLGYRMSSVFAEQRT